jgi:hypothetical protein
MPMTPAQTRARAQKAARERWHGANADTAEQDAELERAQLDRHIAELVAAAPRMTPEQRDTIRRVFRYGPAPEGGATG